MYTYFWFMQGDIGSDYLIMWLSITSNRYINIHCPAPALGGVWTPPSQVFGTPVHTSFLHTLWKFQTQVTQGQVTRSRQVASPQKKFECLSNFFWGLTSKMVTANDWSTWNFQQLIFVMVSMKLVSRNFDIGDLRSGQFCDLSITSQWEKNERHLFWTKTIRNTFKHQVTCRLNTLSRNIATSDPSSCCQGHFRSWKVTSSLKPPPVRTAQVVF